MENFLPQDYAIPSNKGYMKLKTGENNFRIMSPAIIGYEYWTNDNKPVRSKEMFKETPDIKVDKFKRPTRVKHFWAFIVYNYEDRAIQILQITQSTIQEQIKAIIDNKKWGNPMMYDITINKVGEDLQTSYSVVPNPHSDLEKTIKDEFKSKVIDLDKLYSGENPFEGESLIEAEEGEEDINVNDIPF